MSDPKKPTRGELARVFNNDQRLIRAFEKIFDLIPGELETNSTEIADGVSKANNSLSVANDALTISKSNKVLLWLSI